MIKVLVCGGRDYTECWSLRHALELLNERCGGIHIAHGGARGADEAAGEIAAHYGWPCTVFKADWNTYGKSAGMIRNKNMLMSFVPDLVLAVKGGAGTENMKKIAKEKGFVVLEVFQ